MSDHALLEKLLNLPEFTITDLKHNDYDIRVYKNLLHAIYVGFMSHV